MDAAELDAEMDESAISEAEISEIDRRLNALQSFLKEAKTSGAGPVPAPAAPTPAANGGAADGGASEASGAAVAVAEGGEA